MKWEHGLSRKRQVLAIAQALNVAPSYVAGACMVLWEWAGEQSDDGRLPDCDAATLDGVAQLPGLAAALARADVGWLMFEDGGKAAVILRWNEHCSAVARKRAEAAQRVGKHRRRADVTQSRYRCNAEALQGNTSASVGAQAGEGEGLTSAVTQSRYSARDRGAEKGRQRSAQREAQKGVASAVTQSRYSRDKDIARVRACARSDSDTDSETNSDAREPADKAAARYRDGAEARNDLGLTAADTAAAGRALASHVSADAWRDAEPGARARLLVRLFGEQGDKLDDRQRAEYVACVASSVHELSPLWYTYVLWCKYKRGIRGKVGAWVRVTLADVRQKLAVEVRE